MNDTLKTIVGLLDTGKPELQVAAAQILGELHVKDANAVRALAHGLRRSPVLARFCIDALAKIATPEAIELVAKAAIEADSLGDHAAHLVGDLGAAAQQVLASAYGLASSDARKRILGLLGKHPTKEAGPVLVQALLSPEAAEHAARLVAAAREHIDPAVAKAMSAALGRHLHEPLRTSSRPSPCWIRTGRAMRSSASRNRPRRPTCAPPRSGPSAAASSRRRRSAR